MKTIHLIFEKTDTDIATCIKESFMKKGIELTDTSDSSYSFETKDEAYTDSVVVILSDNAVVSDEWQRKVRAVPESFRMIPVGNTFDADYSDPAVVPTRVEEINSIRVDESLMDSIYDSLITDPNLYNVKNELLSMMSRYYVSDRSRDFLMTDRKVIKSYYALITKAAEREERESVRTQYSEMVAYLRTSGSHANLIFRRDLKRYIKNGLMLCAAVAVLILVIRVRSIMERATFGSSILAQEFDTQASPVRAIEAVEALTNPLFPDESKSVMYNMLTNALDENWENSPLGMGNYKWSINDVAYAGDADHLLTAEGDGSVVKWDVISGKPVRKEKVTNHSLGALAVSADNRTRVCIDNEGDLYYSLDEGDWKATGYTCEVAWVDTLRLKLSADGKKLMAFDDSSFILLGFDHGDISELFKKRYEGIRDADFDRNGVAHILRNGDGRWYIVEAGTDGKEIVMPTDVSVNETCKPDLRGDTAALVDSNGQVLLVDVNEPDKKISSGLVLGNPIAVALSDRGYLLNMDRNTGVRIYDYQRGMDLGGCTKFAYSANRVEMIGDMAVAFAGGMIHSENIGDLLPLDSIENTEIVAEYEGVHAVGNGVVKSISVKNKYMLEMLLDMDNDLTVVFDPSVRFFIGEAQRDESLMNGISDDYAYYSGVFVHFTGEPTLVGIIQDEDVVLIGGYDGSFYELYVESDGSAAVTSRKQVPSHSPVEKIYQADDVYYLKDRQGNIWKTRIGYRTLKSEEGMVAEVKQRLRIAVDDDLLNMVSKETKELLDLKRAPGADGKEWE